MNSQDDGRIRLRPHHLLCTQGYSGKGYDDAFVQNMNQVVSRLRNDPNTEIELVFTTDDLCARCPNKLREGVCDSDAKVLRYDRKVTAYFSLQEGKYRYGELTRRIDREMTGEMLDDICGDCAWYSVSACRRNILSES